MTQPERSNPTPEQVAAASDWYDCSDLMPDLAPIYIRDNQRNSESWNDATLRLMGEGRENAIKSLAALLAERERLAKIDVIEVLQADNFLFADDELAALKGKATESDREFTERLMRGLFGTPDECDEHERIGATVFDVLPHIAAHCLPLRQRIEEAEGLLDRVLADHDERVSIYGQQENQPNRYKIMESIRAYLAKQSPQGDATHHATGGGEE